jgi:hypothetical protein
MEKDVVLGKGILSDVPLKHAVDLPAGWGGLEMFGMPPMIVFKRAVFRIVPHMARPFKHAVWSSQEKRERKQLLCIFPKPFASSSRNKENLWRQRVSLPVNEIDSCQR